MLAVSLRESQKIISCLLARLRRGESSSARASELSRSNRDQQRDQPAAEGRQTLTERAFFLVRSPRARESRCLTHDEAHVASVTYVTTSSASRSGYSGECPRLSVPPP